MIFESFKIALSSLLTNKLRSILTMLGIIVGIGSVIAVISLGEGGKAAILGEFNEIGASTIIISADRNKASKDDFFTKEDVNEIKKNINGVKYSSGDLSIPISIDIDNSNHFGIIIAYDIDDIYFNNLDIIYGRNFTNIDHESNIVNIIIEESNQNKKISNNYILGESVSLNYKSKVLNANVIGVSKSSNKILNSIISSSSDIKPPIIIYAPIDKVFSLADNTRPMSNIMVATDDPNSNDFIGEQVIKLLESRHSNSGENIYTKRNAADILKQIDSVLGLITSFISAVAGISLLVGGIGVMNIMLVSVTERTREIGIRKALGATRANILFQFLTESIILTLIGGVLGILFGFSLATIIGRYADFEAIISIKSILIAVIFSSSVGLFFGIYPARKASSLHPIDALRYE